MADNSAIEWTDATWNPIRASYFEFQPDGSGKKRIGWHCEHVSEGCRHCYAERLNLRLGTGQEFKPGMLKSGEVEVFLDEKMLTLPLRWKRPRMVFVCSMTDLFADFVPDAWIDQAFAVMAMAPQHTFQVLTKRPERMRAYLGDMFAFGMRIGNLIMRTAKGNTGAEAWVINLVHSLGVKGLPLPNVWLGTSVEDQAAADKRIPELLATPAAVRFISAEPLLGPILLWHIGISLKSDDVPGLDWVIVGGESGPQARPMHPDWARSLRDQCARAVGPEARSGDGTEPKHNAGVAFFFKQWGEWAPHKPAAGGDLGGDMRAGRVRIVQRDREPDGHFRAGDLYMRRVGKKRAGRLLDGLEHNAMPARQTSHPALRADLSPEGRGVA